MIVRIVKIPDISETKKCHCFKKAIIDLLYEQSNLKEILKKENFSNFALDYYSTNFIDPRPAVLPAR